MKNEAKQKKEYSTPTVKVVELKHQAQLMETSGVGTSNNWRRVAIGSWQTRMPSKS